MWYFNRMIKALKLTLAIALGAFVLLFLVGNKNANAASFDVAAGYDEATTNGSCALTEALGNIENQAQTYPDCPAGSGGGNDIINLPVGTITLVEGMSEMSVPFSVIGQGKDQSFIDGGGMDFVFKFYESGVTYFSYNLSFEDFSISNITNGICISAGSFFNSSDEVGLSIDNVNFNDCSAGIVNTLDNGTTHIAGVDMRGTNGSTDESAGITIFNTGNTVDIVNSTVSNYSFGIYAIPGAAINLINNTVSGNKAGVVVAGSPATLYHNTIVGNSSDSATIEAFQLDSTGLIMFSQNMVVDMKNNIIANNYLVGNLDNCSTGYTGFPMTVTVTSQNNLSDDTCAGKMGGNDQVSISGLHTRIGTLQDNGGGVRTMALLAGSEAIDTAFDGTGVETDARGVDRPQLAGFDIGAFEKTADDPEIDIPPQEDPEENTPKPPRTGLLLGTLMIVLSGMALFILVSKEVIDLNVKRSKSSK